jgi:hypothetical protein
MANPNGGSYAMMINTVLVTSGLVARPLLGGLISGLDRIITARFQSIHQKHGYRIPVLGREIIFMQGKAGRKKGNDLNREKSSC